MIKHKTNHFNFGIGTVVGEQLPTRENRIQRGNKRTQTRDIVAAKGRKFNLIIVEIEVCDSTEI